MDEETEGNPRTDKDILKQAREDLRWCIDTNEEERKKQKDDLKFSTLEQWDSKIRSARETDPNGARPCLTIDKINQYISQVVNDFRQNPVTGKVRPVSEDADQDAADVFQGAVRNIEDHSLASVAYTVAGDWAVRVGEGYWRYLTEFKDEKSFKQKIIIKPITDMFSCYLGPHKMPDGSDAEYGFIFEDMPEDKFERLYPKAKKNGDKAWESLGEFDTYWHEKDSVKVAEYFYTEYTDETIVFTDDGKSMTQQEYDDIPEPPQIPGMPPQQKPAIQKTRETQLKSVKWCKLTGIEVLEKRDWAGKYIPIVKVVGKEAWVEGKRRCWGLVRPAKDSLRMYNYWASALTEKLALSPKAPFIGAKGQFTDPRWAKANQENFASLEYDMIEINGQLAPPPQRQQPTQIEAGLMQMFPLIEHDVQTSLGMFKASLGEERPQQSGKAILALTRESDTGTYHFAGNMGLSVCHGTRILIDLIPKIYDTEEIMHMLGEDGQVQQAKLDPNQQVAVKKIQDLDGKIKKVYNLGIGDYGVTVTVGPSFNTRRMENAALFTDLANSAKDPGSAAVLHYLAVKNADLEGGREASLALKSLLPPPVQQALNKDAPQIPPEVAQKMQQLQQALMEAHKQNQELQSGVQETKMKVDAHMQESMATTQAKQQTHEKEMELARAKSLDEHNLARAKAADEAQLARERAQAEIQVIRERAQAEAQLAREKADLEASIAKYKSDKEAETKIEVAEITAQSTLQAAQIQAANAAVEGGETKSTGSKSASMPDIHIHMPSGKKKLTTPDGKVYTSEDVADGSLADQQK